MRVAKVWVRHCSWGVAAAWGGGAAALLVVAWIVDPDRIGGGLVAAISNGILLLFVVGGLSVVDNLRALDSTTTERALLRRPWLLAAVPAIATLIVLLPLRIVALATGTRGPWSGLGESALDIAGRAGIVWVVLGVVGTLLTRRTST